MAVNFALEGIGTEVSCDKVSSDGYEPGNLLGKGGVWQQQGFLAERFIKPPVTLTLKFPCPVHISHILLDPQVGSQRSAVIEVYTAVCSRMQRLNRTELSASEPQQNTPSESEPIFKKVGYIRCIEQGRVYMNNPRCNNSSTGGGSMESCPHRSELRHHHGLMLTSADFLSIRIKDTVNGSLAAIGRLEVWGQPARSCAKQVKDNIFQKYAEVTGMPVAQRADPSSLERSARDVKQGDVLCRLNHKANGMVKQEEVSVHKLNNQETSSLNPMSPQVPGKDGVNNDIEIPDEFLDELTCHIMSTPMLLPSGHSVDVSTLDRFSDTEATYGRLPSDPYTGLSFTATRKPVLNETLKMRIDRFLSEHSDEPGLRNVPRVLGRASQSFTITAHSTAISGNKHVENASQVTDLKRKKECDSQRNSKRTCTQTTWQSLGSNRNRTRNCGDPVQNESKSKKVKTEKDSAAPPNIAKSLESPEVHSYPKATASCASGLLTSTGNSESSNSRVECHEERLRSSLSSSLSSVLRGLPSFTAATNPQNMDKRTDMPTQEHMCIACRTKLGQVSESGIKEMSKAYMLPCKHLLCRSCLTGMGNTGDVECYICHRHYARRTVIHTHL